MTVSIAVSFSGTIFAARIAFKVVNRSGNYLYPGDPGGAVRRVRDVRDPGQHQRDAGPVPALPAQPPVGHDDRVVDAGGGRLPHAGQAAAGDVDAPARRNGPAGGLAAPVPVLGLVLVLPPWICAGTSSASGWCCCSPGSASRGSPMAGRSSPISWPRTPRGDHRRQGRRHDPTLHRPEPVAGVGAGADRARLVAGVAVPRLAGVGVGDLLPRRGRCCRTPTSGCWPCCAPTRRSSSGWRSAFFCGSWWRSRSRCWERPAVPRYMFEPAVGSVLLAGIGLGWLVRELPERIHVPWPVGTVVGVACWCALIPGLHTGPRSSTRTSSRRRAAPTSSTSYRASSRRSAATRRCATAVPR